VLLLCTVVTAALAFDAIRYQPWFALSAVALAATTLARVRPAPAPLDTRFLRLGAVGLAAFALIATVSAARAQTTANARLLERVALSEAPQREVSQDDPRRRLWDRGGAAS